MRLRYRPPYDWAAMLGHLKTRAIDGIERVDGEAYERTIAFRGKRGLLAIAHTPRTKSLTATIHFPDEDVIAQRLRRMFDVDADVTAIGAHLALDPLLAPLVAARPGLRVAGTWNGFELAVRAVLGQQVTVEAGRKLASELVRLCGRRMRTGRFAFPSAAEVARADLGALGMPKARKDTLHAIARADPSVFEASDDLDRTLASLRAIRGVGDWTAQYIALRAARAPDAFPATDVALLRAAGLSSSALLTRAERWRPWRAYAAQHLWSSLAMDKPSPPVRARPSSR